MALISINYLSYTSGVQTECQIVIPDIYDKEKNYIAIELRDMHIVWLLHGNEGNHTDWQRYTRLENYVNRYKVIVVLPTLETFDFTEISELIKHLFSLPIDLSKCDGIRISELEKEEEYRTKSRTEAWESYDELVKQLLERSNIED